MELTPIQRKTCLQLLSLFEIDGKKASETVTEGQLEIFGALIFRTANRLQIISSTQYGKSLTVALACIIISCIQGELIAVVAPKNEQAKIIMRYFIKHIGDNELFYSQLEKDTKLDRLQMEESKERIVLRNGGGIYVLSAQAGNSQKGIQSAMGAGAKIVIQDESGLIPDEVESTIFRMIAGHADAFYCKIGNPFYRNHFLKSWHNPTYTKIFIDYQRAIHEGRYSQDFIEEARKKPYFSVLYECKFPEDDAIDKEGYIPLFTEQEIETAKKQVKPFGELRIGCDIAEGGGDDNVSVLRTANYATVMYKYKTADTMDVASKIADIAQTIDIIDQNIFIDTIGVGKGVYDRLKEQHYNSTSVKFSEKPEDESQFLNLRAECYWRLKSWIRNGGSLDPEDDWSDLLMMKYKVNPSGKLQIIGKDKIREVYGVSPDNADALAMTFARRNVLLSKKDREQKKLVKEFDAFARSKNKYFTGASYLRRNG